MPMMILNSTVDPWATIADRMNRDARIDRNLATELKDLSVEQSRTDKLATALEEGRIYGLRQAKYNHILRAQLMREKVPMQEHW
jgi:hypothetical protein